MKNYCSDVNFKINWWKNSKMLRDIVVVGYFCCYLCIYKVIKMLNGDIYFIVCYIKMVKQIKAKKKDLGDRSNIIKYQIRQCNWTSFSSAAFGFAVSSLLDC